jgi:UDP-glucose 4-epimerase
MLYPREYNAVNVGGTVSVMEAMHDAGVKRVVLVSSGAVYGEQATQPLHEGLTPNPRSPYAVSKLCAEYYVRAIGALWGIETVALRVFNAYGPGQPLPATHPPVIPHLLKQALTGGSLVVRGDGTHTRDYVYIDDVVEALVAATTAKTVDRLVINVGSGQEISVRDLVRLVGAATQRRVEPIFARGESGDVPRMRADLSLAAQKLNFAPRIGLPEGLRLTLERDPRFRVT